MSENKESGSGAEFLLSAELAQEPLDSLRVATALTLPSIAGPTVPLVLTGTSDGVFRLWGCMTAAEAAPEDEKKQFDELFSTIHEQPSVCGWTPRFMFSGAQIHGEKGLVFCSSSIGCYLPHSGDDQCLTVVTGGSDNVARVWKVTNAGEFQQVLEGHNGHVNSVDIAENGDIVTGSFDK
jgi:WD40 repeat protein